ncbi:MAG: antirestriction protein [Aquabacterium sp.]
MEIKQSEVSTSIVLHGQAKLVPESRRLEFLPMLFGEQLMIIGEMTVFSLMSKFSPDYHGGLWDFVEVPNGGYMRPSVSHDSRLYKFSCPDNWFEGEVSADAAGIIVTLIALSHMSFKDRTDRCADHFHALRDFVDGHPEASLIYRAID